MIEVCEQFNFLITSEPYSEMFQALKRELPIRIGCTVFVKIDRSKWASDERIRRLFSVTWFFKGRKREDIKFE